MLKHCQTLVLFYKHSIQLLEPELKFFAIYFGLVLIVFHFLLFFGFMPSMSSGLEPLAVEACGLTLPLLTCNFLPCLVEYV